MNDTDLLKFHFAAVQMILSLDQPKLTEEKINRLKKISDELKLTWSVDLMKFFLQTTLGTYQILRILCKKNAEENK